MVGNVPLENLDRNFPLPFSLRFFHPVIYNPSLKVSLSSFVTLIQRATRLGNFTRGGGGGQFRGGHSPRGAMQLFAGNVERYPRHSS